MKNASRLLYLALAALILFTAAGCATVQPKGSFDPGIAQPTEEQPGKGWWTARYHMNWPEGADPAWHVDALLAHEVVAPVLNRHRERITLWRFHRRAARDKSGHQFSFLIYASQETAKEVLSALRGDTRVRELMAAGIILREYHDDTGRIERPNVEDTSDRGWSVPVQKSWPYFIMGVSELWLRLVSQMAEEASGAKKSLLPQGRVEFYRQVNASVEQTWQQEGGHAFLHHLNAIFGYEPVVVTERRSVRF